jgi:PPOX class probable F420-dependent enzyme
LATANLTEAQRAFLHEPYAATVTTLRRDGSPHSTVVWVDEQDGDVRFNITLGRAKERQLRHDPRASVLVIDPADHFKWLAVSGSATLSTDGAAEHMAEIWRSYRGEPYPYEAPTDRVIVRLRPEHVDSAGL